MAEFPVPGGVADRLCREQFRRRARMGQARTRRTKPSELLVSVRDQMSAYFDGKLEKFNLPLAPAGTEFQRGVWQAMTQIPYGQTQTYGDLAADSGSLARAVGGACGKNPIPIIIPCHRVMGGGGKLTGFSGGAGPESKVFLLKLEGAMFL